MILLLVMLFKFGTSHLNETFSSIIHDYVIGLSRSRLEEIRGHIREVIG